MGAQFIDGGRAVLTSTSKSNMLVWDAATGEQQRAYAMEALPHWWTLGPDGRTGLVSYLRGAELWDLLNGRRIAPLPTLSGRRPGAWSPSGAQLATRGARGRLALRTADGELDRVLDPAGPDWNEAAFSHDGARLIASHQGRVAVWDLKTGAKREMRGGEHPLVRWAEDPNGRQIAAGDTRGTVFVWDARTGAWAHTLPAHVSFAGQVRFVGPSRLLTGGRDGVVKLWDADTGTLLHTFATMRVRGTRRTDPSHQGSGGNK